MVLAPVVLPFFVYSLKGRGLPETLSWWKSMGSGIASFFIYLPISWLLGFPERMVPAFGRDLLYWGLHEFLALGLAALIGLWYFRRRSFQSFLSTRTLFPFVMGLYLPGGVDNIVRYIHVQDSFVLFGLPAMEFFFLCAVGIILLYGLDAEGGRRLLIFSLVIPAAFLAALVPALFYSFYWLGTLAVMLPEILLVAWLAKRESLV
jgi:hypothetical protein